MSAKGFVLFFVVALFQQSSAYSYGAPEAACYSMEPRHGAEIQTGKAPYSVNPAKGHIKPGETVQVVIEANPGFTFRGFMIKAINPDDSSMPLGTFVRPPRRTRTVDCVKGKKNMLTHENASERTKLEMTWQAPAGYEGSIEFRATILKDYMEYWVNVPSSIGVHVGNSPPAARSGANGDGDDRTSLVEKLVTLLDSIVKHMLF